MHTSEWIFEGQLQRTKEKRDIRLSHPQEQEQLQLPSNSPGIPYVGRFGGKMREPEIHGFDGKIRQYRHPR